MKSSPRRFAECQRRLAEKVTVFAAIALVLALAVAAILILVLPSSAVVPSCGSAVVYGGMK